MSYVSMTSVVPYMVVGYCARFCSAACVMAHATFCRTLHFNAHAASTSHAALHAAHCKVCSKWEADLKGNIGWPGQLFGAKARFSLIHVSHRAILWSSGEQPLLNTRTTKWIRIKARFSAKRVSQWAILSHWDKWHYSIRWCNRNFPFKWNLPAIAC